MARQLASIDDETGEMVIVKQRQYPKRRENFCMVYQHSLESLVGRKDLHGTELKILLSILSKINYDNIAIVTQPCIAKELGTTQPAISNGLKKLIGLGLITKVKVHGATGFKVNAEFATKGHNK